MSIAGLSGLRWGLKETKNRRGGLPWLRPVMARASSPAFSVLAFTVLLAFFRSTIRGQKKIQHARLGERFNYRVIPNFTNQNTQCLIKYSEVNLKVVPFRRTHQFFILRHFRLYIAHKFWNLFIVDFELFFRKIVCTFNRFSLNRRWAGTTWDLSLTFYFI